MIRYGLDFGTTNSSLSLSQEGRPGLLQIDDEASDPTVIRSLLYFFHRDLIPKKDKFGREELVYVGDFRYTFGQDALLNYLQDNKNRHPGITRQIFTGKTIQTNISPNAGKADLVEEYFEEVDYGTGRLLQALKTALKSPTYKGTNIFGKFFTLEQMIGIFASLIKNKAGANIDCLLRVGRPVRFLEDPEKDREVQNRLEEALKMVGFSKIEFEYEPVAAAKYFLWKYPSEGRKVLVFDFGGGTLDTAIVDRENGFRILATDGVYIGGNLLNSDIMADKILPYFGVRARWGEQNLEMPANFAESLKSWYGIISLNNPSDMAFLEKVRQNCSDPVGIERLIYLIKMNLGFEIYEVIEEAKKKLSESERAAISFSDGPIEIKEEVSKLEFENLIKPRITEVEETVWRTLGGAKLRPEDIGVVVRTGGSSLIPMVEKMLARVFGQEKVQLFDPFTSIAAGLALDQNYG